MNPSLENNAVRQRRTSARITKLKADEALRRTSARITKLKSDEALRRREEEANALKRSRIHEGKRPMVEEEGIEEVEVPPVQVNVASGSSQTVTRFRPNPGVECADSPSDLSDQEARQRVKETLRIFNKYLLHFSQVEEKRTQAEKLPAQANRSSPESTTPTETNAVVTKRKVSRADLKTLSKMIENREILKLNPGYGPVPGIDVGHQFFSRAEMVILGLHNSCMNGIDYIPASAEKKFRNLTLPLARCIVLSGKYEDDLDNFESIVYSGQGGNNSLGDKTQTSDQKMIRGNLGLKNCMEQKIPVRVVRGHKCKNSYLTNVYTYDGLYEVISYCAERGISGFIVYKFTLVRSGGQPVLNTDKVQFIRRRPPVSVSTSRGLVCQDISNGQEGIPIPASNVVDEPPVPPTGFTYISEIQLAKNVKEPEKAAGCKCIGLCQDNKKCSCAKLNGSDFPYVKNNGGRLVEPKAVVFECGPNCSCDAACCNRTSQKGLRFPLEVFRTPKKGWGVRSWDFIPSGSPVCEYIGVLKKTEDLDASSDNYYIFDIDCLQTMKGLDGREKRLRDVSLSSVMEESDDLKSDSQPEFCIDASSMGNVARFINHSCEPNLFVQCVLSNHHDLNLAKIFLFAAENIQPLEELTYDYGYVIDSVVGPDGEIKKMECYCGAVNCRKRLL